MTMPTPTPYGRTILYGDIGKRKTTTACSLIFDRGLLINADYSWDVLLKPEHKDLLSKTDIIVYEGLSQLPTIDYYEYDTVILDGFDSMVDRFGDTVLDKAHWAKDGYREKLIVEDGSEKDLQGVTTKAMIDYMVIRDKFRPIIQKYILSLEAHVIFVCHSRIPLFASLGESKTIRPALPDATAKIITKPASIIGHMEVLGKNNVVGVNESTTRYVGKSRIKGISGEMTTEKFVAAYKEHYG